MSLAERYSRAARSSDLELKVDIGDVDYLIAAGLVRESLATRLIRLRDQYDKVNRDRSAMRLLRSFADTRFVLMAYAVSEAPVRSTLTDNEAADIAVRVLDLWLDPICPACDRRGFNGALGTPQILCTACRGSGEREAYWKNDAQEGFAGWLLSSMDMKIARALAEISRFMRQTGPDTVARPWLFKRTYGPDDGID